MKNANDIFLIFSLISIIVIPIFILLKKRAKLTVLTTVIISGIMTGFVGGISNEPASIALIPLVSGVVVVLITLFPSNLINSQNINIQQISSLLTIFLIIMFPVYLYSNYLRFNCNNIIGLMGFGSEHCKDSQASVLVNTSNSVNKSKPSMARIRCEYIGVRLEGCENFQKP